MTRSGKRILAVFGSLLALVATGSLLAGTALFFVHVIHRGENGFFTTPSAYISAGTHALTSAEATLGAIPGEWVPSNWLSTVQVSVSPTGNTPVFVGIGPESQVDSYLEGVAVAEITKIESDTHYLTNAAIQREISPAPPSEQTFWATSAEGHGSQTVVWDLEPGQWKVVIMNADASRDISVEMFTGARTAWSSVSIIALSAGGLVLAAGAGLALLGAFRRPTGSRLIVTPPPKP
jgi:hypothetical protein